jgi:hypothetical protein
MSVTHKLVTHRVWVDGDKRMTQLVVLCGAARANDTLTTDLEFVTCFECLLAPANQKVLHIQLFANGLPIPEVEKRLLSSTE